MIARGQARKGLLGVCTDRFAIATDPLAEFDWCGHAGSHLATVACNYEKDG